MSELDLDATVVSNEDPEEWDYNKHSSSTKGQHSRRR